MPILIISDSLASPTLRTPDPYPVAEWRTGKRCEPKSETGVPPVPWAHPRSEDRRDAQYGSLSAPARQIALGRARSRQRLGVRRPSAAFAAEHVHEMSATPRSHSPHGQRTTWFEIVALERKLRYQGRLRDRWSPEVRERHRIRKRRRALSITHIFSKRVRRLLRANGPATL